tara:strand:- start:384 stop:1655 length:1272 start_codon:yes stop_codon:yes gene_type:complete
MAIGDSSTADGYFKQIYGELSDTVPEHSVLAQDIPFQKKERLGDSYHFPVRLRRTQGVTYKSGTGSMGAFSLNAVRSGVMQDASVKGSTFVGRESFGYKAVLSATAAGPQAFGDLFDEGVEDLHSTAAFAREMSLLYGGSNIGKANTVGAVTGAGSAGDPYRQEVTLHADSTAMGLWAQMEGALIDAYNPGMDTLRNASGGLVVIKAEDAGSNTVQLTLEPSASADDVESGDVLVPHGAKGNWMDGLDKIITNSGSLFSISAATYPLWKGNSYAVGGALTMQKVASAAALIVPRAGAGNLKLYCSVPTWVKLNEELVGYRRIDTAGGVQKLGAEEIEYFGPNGLIRIKPHPMVKNGEAFLLDPSKVKRVGASDITFNLGVEGQADKFLRELPDAAGFEVRCLWDQGIIHPRPAATCKLTGITN